MSNLVPTAGAAEEGSAQVVRAAGAVCWRPGANGLEVLLIHRPAYNDWSLPKGKLKTNELTPTAAVREVAEETGLRVRLGRPLPPVSYRDGRGRLKIVTYWAAEPLARVGRPDPREIDDARWFDLATARSLLTQANDVPLVDRVAELAAADELDTSAVLVVRHGTARPRDAWARADADRPLIASGRRQAAALADLLYAWRPDNALSSPWVRCRDTLAPYARSAGLKVNTRGSLSERGFRRNPHKVARHTRGLLDQAGTSLLCTHRPVLPGVLAEIAKMTPDPNVSAALPQSDPYLAPGEVLVVHVARPWQRSPRVVALEQHVTPR